MSTTTLTPSSTRYSPTLRKDLRANLGDGLGFSLMVGLGETYLPAFALALGMGEVVSGLVASVPMMAGALLQLASPAAVRKLGSHRRWVILCATCQALSFVPLIVAALVGQIPGFWVFAIATLYWGAGLATGPAWNTWMEGLIPRPIRPRFFAYRTRLTQIGLVTGLLAGGMALQFGKAHGQPLAAFAVLFAIACASRCLSAVFLTRQSEPPPCPERLRGIDTGQVLRRFRRGGSGILFYLLAVQAAVWLSGPFFTPYMLKKLHLSYSSFAILTAAAVTAKVISLPFFGRYAQRAGTKRLLWIGGLGIVPLSGLWLVSGNFYYLMVLQIVGGVAWAAYELAMFLLFFETIDARERTGVLTIYNVGNALATVGGSLVGWALLKSMGETQQAFLTLFFLSSCCRIAALVLLARVTGVIDVVVRHAAPVVMRIVSVNPAMGSIDRPILPSMPNEEPVAPPVTIQPQHKPSVPMPAMAAKAPAMADNVAAAS